MTDAALDRDTRILRFLDHVHPYDSLPREERARIAGVFVDRLLPAETVVYSVGETLEGLYLIEHGTIEVTDENGAPVSVLQGRNSFGERGLVRDGLARTNARALEETHLLMLPAEEFARLREAHPAFARFFDRGRGAARERRGELATQRVGDLMAHPPVTVTAATPIREAAARMPIAQVATKKVGRGELLGIEGP